MVTQLKDISGEMITDHLATNLPQAWQDVIDQFFGKLEQTKDVEALLLLYQRMRERITSIEERGVSGLMGEALQYIKSRIVRSPIVH